MTFSKKMFSSKDFSGHVECSFENPFRSFPPECPCFSAQNEKLIEKWKFLMKKHLSLKFFSGQLECIFDHPI